MRRMMPEKSSFRAAQMRVSTPILVVPVLEMDESFDEPFTQSTGHATLEEISLSSSFDFC